MSSTANTDAGTLGRSRQGPSHIGIVACSAEGAALCYRTICIEGPRLLGPHAHPEVSMHTPVREYTQLGYREDWQGVGRIDAPPLASFARIGADFLICPRQHRPPGVRLRGTAIPPALLHIAEVVAEEAVARGFRCLGLTGTRWLVDSEVYPEKLSARGLAYIRPTSPEREEINRIIMEELVYGIFKSEAVAYHQQVMRRMQDAGCDAVVLGCTEIPLLMNDGNSPLPTLDSTRLLARAALRRAVGGD